VDRDVELRLYALGTHGIRRFGQCSAEMLRCGQNNRVRNGVNRVQCEDRIVVVVEGGLMQTMALEDAVSWDVTMNDDLYVAVVLPFMNVLRRDHGHQPSGQAQHGRKNP
jgi:hypothetical protein